MIQHTHAEQYMYCYCICAKNLDFFDKEYNTHIENMWSIDLIYHFPYRNFSKLNGMLYMVNTSGI